jgi:hypothetical protein
LEISRIPAAAATAYATPMVASGGTPARWPPPSPKNIAPASAKASAKAVGWPTNPEMIPEPPRKSASAMPADESCASAAPTKTMRRSTTYTPSTEQAMPITSAP